MLGVIVWGVGTLLIHLSMRRRRRSRQNEVQKEVDSPTPTVVHGHSVELEGTLAGSEMEDLSHVRELSDNKVGSLEA